MWKQQSLHIFSRLCSAFQLSYDKVASQFLHRVASCKIYARHFLLIVPTLRRSLHAAILASRVLQEPPAWQTNHASILEVPAVP